MSEFVHLHCHTEYSLLDGAIRLNDLCARAKDFGMPAAAITDHGNCTAAAYFYTDMQELRHQTRHRVRSLRYQGSPG